MTLREFIDKKQEGRTIDVEGWYKYIIKRQIAWCLLVANTLSQEETNPQKVQKVIEERWQELLTMNVNEAFRKIGFNEVENNDLS